MTVQYSNYVLLLLVSIEYCIPTSLLGDSIMLVIEDNLVTNTDIVHDDDAFVTNKRNIVFSRNLLQRILLLLLLLEAIVITE